LSHFDAFERGLRDPEAAQLAVLARLLRDNASCAYGRDHGFAACTRYDQFAARVPVVRYDDLAPYVERVVAGEPGVLIADPVVYLATSSGTTGRKKYVPIHERFVAESDHWMALEQHFLGLIHPLPAGTRELRYINRIEGKLPSGIPIGSVSGWYYGKLVELGRYDEVVPYSAYQLESVLGRNYAVLRFALAERIGRLTAVNPSTLLLLAQRLAADGTALIRDVRAGTLTHPEIPPATAQALAARLSPDPERARRLEAVAEGRLNPRAVWPELSVLSCWMHAGAGLYQKDLADTFAGAPVWDYGYTSTEGRVTVTVHGDGAGVPLLDSVFLELRDQDGSVRPLFAVDDGSEGELLVTNSRGLYRYTMGDVVCVVGRIERAPLLRFRRKTTAVASLTGEKLTEEQVVRVVEHALASHRLRTRFFCLAPEWGTPPRYLLLLELDGPSLSVSDARVLIAEIERQLCAANAEYERKRETLRLGPPALLVLHVGEYERYLARLTGQGRELARIKVPRVTMDVELARSFAGERVDLE
jgi:hypothetical protein